MFRERKEKALLYRMSDEVEGMIESENYCFANSSISIASGKDNPWMLKSLEERSLRVGYSFSSSMSLHDYLLPTKEGMYL